MLDGYMQNYMRVKSSVANICWPNVSIIPSNSHAKEPLSSDVHFLTTIIQVAMIHWKAQDSNPWTPLPTGDRKGHQHNKAWVIFGRTNSLTYSSQRCIRISGYDQYPMVLFCYGNIQTIYIMAHRWITADSAISSVLLLPDAFNGRAEKPSGP